MMMGMCYNFFVCTFRTDRNTFKGSDPVMMKKILCLLAVLSLCAVFPALAEEPQPVTAGELAELLAGVRAQALAASPLNDPSDEGALSEDGTLFRYEVARIYAAGTELAEDTPVNTLVFEDSEGAILRGTGVDSTTADLLAAYPLENELLAGTREEALLYLRDTQDGFVYGRVLRDGQRITSAEYGEVLPEGENFRRVSVTYSLLNGLVTSLRIDGLNPADGLMDASRATELRAELADLAGHDEYQRVKTSLNGAELEPFGEEDLLFSGYSYTELQPDALPGSPEREMIDDEDGTWLLRCDGDGYEAVFRCDAQGQNAEILSFTLLDDETEGPRCVRIGDLFSEDRCRFRFEDNEMTEDLQEVLYGTEDAAQWGTASYDFSSGETGLCYVTDTAAGIRVKLLLKYENNVLSEIILQTLTD